MRSPEPAGAGTDPIITVRNLQFAQGSAFLLRIPELEVFAGDMLAVIGPNGSGKSTLMACLLGASGPHDGEVRVLGHPPGRESFTRRHLLGVQSQGTGFNELYGVRDLQELHRRTYPRSELRIFEAFGVPELASKRFGQLSSGEQQRVQLAMALAHHPQLALFDEPTSNLDPHYEEVFCDTLRMRQQAGDGFTSLFVTHSDRVASLCGELLLLEDGCIDALGSRQALVQERFESVGFRLVGSEAQLDAAASVMHGAGAVCRQHRRADTLTLYGGPALRELAQRLLATHDLERFSLWRPGAADLLESIKHA